MSKPKTHPLAFAAKYFGRCVACSHDITPPQLIQFSKTATAYVHADCSASAPPPTVALSCVLPSPSVATVPPPVDRFEREMGAGIAALDLRPNDECYVAEEDLLCEDE